MRPSFEPAPGELRNVIASPLTRMPSALGGAISPVLAHIRQFLCSTTSCGRVLAGAQAVTCTYLSSLGACREGEARALGRSIRVYMHQPTLSDHCTPATAVSFRARAALRSASALTAEDIQISRCAQVGVRLRRSCFQLPPRPSLIRDMDTPRRPLADLARGFSIVSLLAFSSPVPG